MISLLLPLLFFSCKNQSNSEKVHVIEEGRWRGEISMQGQKMPFNFSLQNDSTGYTITLLNGEEKLLLDEVVVEKDSLKATLHIFDIDLKAKIESPKKISGIYTKNYIDGYELPFEAEFNKNQRFTPSSEVSDFELNDRYEIMFIPDQEDPAYPSVGEFYSNGNMLNGTFLTPTGDYRYLQGNIIGKEIYLSTFDGNHAFLFKAEIKGDSLVNGHFWSGKSWHERWSGVRNELAELSNPDSLTFIKEGYDGLSFEFPDLEGKMISLTDEKYQDKVVLVQIFGSWCPNCMDETKFYKQWYDENHSRGVEIIGLAYEQKDDFEYASSRVKKMKEKLGVNYDFLIAGINDKAEASKTLPMLNKVISYPTTIFIDRSGEVRRIHTGFSGPGTGIHYERFVEDFKSFTEELIDEGN